MAEHLMPKGDSVKIQHLLAVLPVSNIERARDWYERLLGRSPDNQPMDNLAEWRVTETGWLQVFSGAPGRSGTGLANLAVDDLHLAREELVGRGLSPGPIVDASKGVQLVALEDPDGNSISLIGGFRVAY
jgi:glyoxylase I family protein